MSKKVKTFVPAIIMTLVLIGVSVYAALANTFKDLDYKFTGLKFSLAQSLETGLQDLFFTINLVLTNNHATTIFIQAIDFDVSYNGVKIARVEQDSGINISPKQTTVSMLNVEVQTDTLPQTIKSALSQVVQGNTTFNLVFNGTITTQLGTIPLKQNLKIAS